MVRVLLIGVAMIASFSAGAVTDRYVNSTMQPAKTVANAWSDAEQHTAKMEQKLTEVADHIPAPTTPSQWTIGHTTYEHCLASNLYNQQMEAADWMLVDTNNTTGAQMWKRQYSYDEAPSVTILMTDGRVTCSMS